MTVLLAAGVWGKGKQGWDECSESRKQMCRGLGEKEAWEGHRDGMAQLLGPAEMGGPGA